MLLTACLWLRELACLLCCCAMLLGFVPSVGADPKPLTKEEQAKVDKAIDKGVKYLKRTQTEEGDWPRLLRISSYKDKYLAGQSLLPAYALLEAGVPASDPAIKKAIYYILPKLQQSDETYELALGILFFDRLNDPKYKKLIQTLALRLIVGQHRTGGWTYRCLTMTEEDEVNLMRLLGKLDKRLKKGEKPTATLFNALHVPARLRALTVFHNPKKIKWREPPSGDPRGPHSTLLGASTDNSNTQFAMLGLWAARRHGIPVEPTFRLMVERFEKMQNADGSWPYSFEDTMRQRTNTCSMTCVGLLGLAIGHGLKLASSRTNPPDAEDPRVLQGLTALYREVGSPTGQMETSVPRQDVYLLWSLERVGMLFNLPTLGDKEWYRWGAEILVTNQFPNGEWDSVPEDIKLGPAKYGQMNMYGPVLHTAFALLFFKRSHPMKDLTPELPFTAKGLNEGIARLRTGIVPEEPSTTSPSRRKKPDR